MKAIPTLLLLLLVGSAAVPAQQQDLWQAARLGDLAGVKAALDAGASIDGGDRWDNTAIYLAARAGHLEVARWLIENGADVDVRESFYGTRPLEAALQGGHYEVANLLLASGAEGREQALAFGLLRGQPDVARAAIESGPIYASALEQLRSQVEDPEMRALLAKARSEPDPEPPKLTSEQIDRMTGRFEGWVSDSFVAARREGDGLVLTIDGGEPIAMQITGEQSFRSADGSIEANFFGRAGSIEGIYLSRPGVEPEMLRRSVAEPVTPPDYVVAQGDVRPQRRTVNWPSFRGLNGDGIGDGADTVTTWDIESGENVRWQVQVPGLGNSSPVVWGDQVFVTTAVAEGRQEGIRVGNTGDGATVAEEQEHVWQVLAFDKKTGAQLWTTEVGRGVPITDRHFKATQANSTVVTDGEHLVAVFPTAGMACLTLDGEIRWKKELGGLAATAFMDPDLEWGYSSSPIIYDDTVILQVDVYGGPYLAAWRLADGEPVWKVERDVAPSFSTPTVMRGEKSDELVVNASTIHGYDPKTGEELWSLGPNSELVIARPVVSDDLAYVSAGYPPVKPIYAVRAGTRGALEVTPGEEHERLAWSHRIGGAYMPSPLLYRGLFYVVHHNGRMVAYDAETGDAYYKTRFSRSGTFTGSPVAVNGKLYLPTEEGLLYVLAAGPEYEELAVNDFEEPLMATPAVSEGVLYVRTPDHLYALGARQ